MPESHEPASLAPKPRTSKLAVASFVMGLVSLTYVLCPFMVLPAIICGVFAIDKIRDSGGNLKGEGYAIAGIVIPVVMVVLAILVSCLPRGDDYPHITVTRADLKLLHEAVNMFRIDTGRCPTEEEGLNALIKKPSGVEGWIEGGYLGVTKIPQDAWKHDFVYKLNPGSGEPVIISYGADGKEGGEGIDADLRSTDE